MYFDKFT